MTTDAQDRIADALVSDPRWGRADVIPRPNAEIEVWLYDTEGVLETISVVKPDGSTRTRPGVRYTDDTYIGPPRDETDAETAPKARRQ